MHAIYIHLCNLFMQGLVQVLVQRIFLDGASEDDQVLRLSASQVLTQLQVPYEHDRKTTALEKGMKSKELKFIGLFVFIHWADDVLQGCDYVLERRLLRLMAFIYRALFLPDEPFRALDATVDLQQLINLWQKTFEQKWGKDVLSYNGHVLHHALENRRRTGPLYETSTEKYESLYGDCKKHFQAGTPNQGKQLLKNFLAADLEFHICPHKRRLRIRDKQTEKTNDQIVTANGDVYKVASVVRPNKEFRVRKLILGTYKTEDKGGPDLDWSLVGIRKFLDVDYEHTGVLTQRQIDGKAVLMDKIVADWPRPWLLSVK